MRGRQASSCGGIPFLERLPPTLFSRGLEEPKSAKQPLSPLDKQWHEGLHFLTLLYCRIWKEHELIPLYPSLNKTELK
jgi:hypothetical protein